MGLRMKKFNILGIHWKIRLSRGREFTKNWYRLWDCLKEGGGGLGQFANLRVGSGVDKKEGDVFEGVDTPMHTMSQECPKKLVKIFFRQIFMKIAI